MTAEPFSESKEYAEFIETEAELAMAIGRIVIHFNILERDLGELLGGLLESNSYFVWTALVASMSFAQKVDLLAALYLEKHKDDLDRCEECRSSIQILRSLEEERNKYVHSVYGTVTFGSSEFIRTKPRTKGAKGLSVAKEKVVIQAMKALKDRITSACFIELPKLYRGCVGPRR